MKLQLVGRNYFDPSARLAIPEFNLEVWPGFVTSIRQHETDIMMCSEISHKVMRTDTVLTTFNQCFKKNSNNYQVFTICFIN